MEQNIFVSCVLFLNTAKKKKTKRAMMILGEGKLDKNPSEAFSLC